MTNQEKTLIKLVDQLLEKYDTDHSKDFSDASIEGFNKDLKFLLETSGISLERYHELLLEYSEELLELDNFSL